MRVSLTGGSRKTSTLVVALAVVATAAVWLGWRGDRAETELGQPRASRSPPSATAAADPENAPAEGTPEPAGPRHAVEDAQPALPALEVSDRTSSRPVENAMVRVIRRTGPFTFDVLATGTTDRSGRWQLPEAGLPADAEVIAAASGYFIRATSPGAITEGGADLRLELQPQTPLFFRVRNVPWPQLSRLGGSMVVQIEYLDARNAAAIYVTKKARRDYAAYMQLQVETRSDGIVELRPPILAPLSASAILRVPGRALGTADATIAEETVAAGGTVELAVADHVVPDGIGDLAYEIELPDGLEGYWQLQLLGPRHEAVPARTSCGAAIGSTRGAFAALPYGTYVPQFFAKELGSFPLEPMSFDGQDLWRVRVETASVRVAVRPFHPDGDGPVTVEFEDADRITTWKKEIDSRAGALTTSIVEGRYCAFARGEGVASAPVWFEAIPEQPASVQLSVLPSATVSFSPARDAPLSVRIEDLTRGGAWPTMRSTGGWSWTLPMGRYDVVLTSAGREVHRSLELNAGQNVPLSAP